MFAHLFHKIIWPQMILGRLLFFKKTNTPPPQELWKKKKKKKQMISIQKANCVMAQYPTQLLLYPKAWMYSHIFRDFMNVIKVTAVWRSGGMLFQKAGVVREECTS